VDVVLETDRMTLRRFTPDDADLLFELDDDPQVMRYITGGPGTPKRVVVEEVLPRWMRLYRRPGHFGYFAAIDRASGEFLGWFHWKPVEGDPRAAELGYRLCRSAWGRGLATEGSRALIDVALREWGVRRVVATAMPENAASRRVMEKSGLRLRGTIPPPPPYQGEDVVYELTVDEGSG
jgi:RimJ/RimL family protein N-acetyltransferase